MIAVVTTVAACAISLVAYNRFHGDAPADKCPCLDAAGTEGSSAQVAHRESLARMLTALAAEKTLRETAKTEPNPPKGIRQATESGDIDQEPVSEEENLAREKADRYTLDAQLKSEEVDTRWAVKVERQMAEAVARLGAKLSLDEVTCRETLCRARITHRDPNARDADVERVMSLSIFPGQATAYTAPDNPQSTVFYFSRKGTTLSVLQPPVHMTLPPEALREEPPSTGGLQ